MRDPVTSPPPRILTAILHHRPLPAGGRPHFDLMIGHPASGAEDVDRRDVRTWRCPNRLDLLEPGEACDAEPIEPHRRWWLGRPIGESHSLRPPLGDADVVGHGVVEHLLESDGEMTFRILWSQYDEVIEYTLFGGILRRAPRQSERPASVPT